MKLFVKLFGNNPKNPEIPKIPLQFPRYYAILTIGSEFSLTVTVRQKAFSEIHDDRSPSKHRLYCVKILVSNFLLGGSPYPRELKLYN